MCLACGRWNLTPFEDRWEAIEDCERLFRATRVRRCTDEIGLARLGSGTDLVRIGRPVLPEFAAWRYGNELLRRRRRHLVRRVAPVVGLPVLIGAAPVVSLVGGPVGAMAYAGVLGYLAFRRHRRAALTIPLASGAVLPLTQAHVTQAELIRAEDEEDQWAMWVGCPQYQYPAGVVRVETALGPRALLTGANGRTAAARILPHLNPTGGDRFTVREAVRWLEAVGGPERALHTFARSRLVRPVLESIERTLVTVHPEARLGLEMALHEEEERRALDGELTILKWAWREEEAIAAIADDLTAPVLRFPDGPVGSL